MAISNPVTLRIAEPAAPLVYDAVGAASVAVMLENPLAEAELPLVSRMTHADQVSKWPLDQGYKFTNQIDSREYVFFTKRTLRNAA